MPERNIAVEVLKGLQEVREHRAGKRTLRETRIETPPPPKPTPKTVDRTRAHSEDVKAVIRAKKPVFRNS
ncbi:MAG: hypothetical protein OXL36_18245 [Bryobacterales bacterium]|nr:hypothetical protein [Bryobacterales bacterium]MDE0293459.1 hypothetical protein [Bryobacterales bacterium]